MFQNHGLGTCLGWLSNGTFLEPCLSVGTEGKAIGIKLCGGEEPLCGPVGTVLREPALLLCSVCGLLHAIPHFCAPVLGL